MSELEAVELSIVVPVYNEADGLAEFQESLIKELGSLDIDYEIIYVDDGSHDETAKLINAWHKDDSLVKLVKLSRNFGKENALAAGIAQASGQAVMMIDGDSQHPVELIGEFIKRWREGNQVVIGVRQRSSGASWFKRSSGRLFYRLYNRLTGERLIPHSTDFRLIDRLVQQEFLKLGESDRLTRGLIDWLGFKRELIYFDAPPRRSGASGYSRGKLMRLATHSFVSMTPLPLYLFGYFGILITSGALLLGSAVFIEQVLLNDPWHWKFSGTAMIGILLLFLVGILLMAQGMLSLYISHIHSQTKRRPLYVIDHEGSVGTKKSETT